jgi:hypothetical protein
MHRSGTSAIASAIEALGFSTGEPSGLLAPDEHNRRGYFEQRAIVDLNDEILDHLGGTALEPRVLGQDWRSDEFLVAAVDRIRSLLEELFSDQSFVVKDPRISVLLPLWRAALDDDVVLAYISRDPWEVAASLQRRDGTTLEMGVATWVQYNQALARDMAGARVHAVRYQDLLDDPSLHLQELYASLVHWGELPGGTDVALAAARFDSSLHRNVAVDISMIDNVLEGEVRTLSDAYQAWRGRHDAFATNVAPTPWWSAALLEDRRTGLKMEEFLRGEIDAWRARYDELAAEHELVLGRLNELRGNVFLRLFVALRRVVRPRRNQGHDA